MKEDRKARRYGPSASMAATAFLAERIMTNKNAKKKAAGKVFDFYKCTPEVQNGIIESRKVEWNKWKGFNAGALVRGEELERLKMEGNVPLPTQWIDTDKDEHLKRPGQEHLHKIKHKSRLVCMGN